MDNTRDELLDLIRNATNIDMICFFAIIYVVAPDSPPYTPIATRGELKKAIKQLRSAQHSQVVKTPPFHGGNAGSIPARATMLPCWTWLKMLAGPSALMGKSYLLKWME